MAGDGILLTQDRLKELLEYNPETGKFVRLISRTSSPKGAVIGSLHSQGYLTVWIDGLHHKCHRLAWLYVHGRWPVAMIDHINGIKSDNGIANLREATASQNLQNRATAYSNNKSSGILGVYWHEQAGKWQAKITLDGKSKSLGLYHEKEQARAAYLAAKAARHPFSVPVTA
jgi:hypothetical protein